MFKARGQLDQMKQAFGMKQNRVHIGISHKINIETKLNSSLKLYENCTQFGIVNFETTT